MIAVSEVVSLAPVVKTARLSPMLFLKHLAFLLVLSAGVCAAEDWKPLFNGQNLDGWTIKITKQALGENYADTFRVEDGIIKVSYDKWDTFENRFGHLYSNVPYSRYVLRLEYKLTGEPMAGIPSWARLNSGVMVHSQSPLSMLRDQEWPVSLEFQFLCENSGVGRQTGNACTPGTNLVLDGEFTTDHVIDSTGPMPKLDEWVQAEIEVHGNDLVIHRINGVEVLRYTHPELDANDPDARRLLAAGAPKQLGFGHLALQAEGQPVWFRNIAIKPLSATAE